MTMLDLTTRLRIDRADALSVSIYRCRNQDSGDSPKVTEQGQEGQFRPALLTLSPVSGQLSLKNLPVVRAYSKSLGDEGVCKCGQRINGYMVTAQQ